MANTTEKSKQVATEEKVPSARDEETARRIATLLSRGNVSLQLGSFETKEDIDSKIDALKDYEF